MFVDSWSSALLPAICHRSPRFSPSLLKYKSLFEIVSEVLMLSPLRTIYFSTFSDRFFNLVVNFVHPPSKMQCPPFYF